MNLAIEDFATFQKGVYAGREPFDWQTRLLSQIVANKRWPSALDLPTGSGKTTCIDIALFALALDAQSEDARWCSRRIAMVVDRRVVVDQAAEHGRRLLRALSEPANDVVREVAGRLRSMSKESSEPLGVYTLRGGMPKDDGWARTPDQPLVIASTVDQLGSRLLIQGYGVSRGMKPVHAGLLGNDTLVLLDEVHLSQPFAETLEQLGHLTRTAGSPAGPRRFHHAFLSATPGRLAADAFRLTDAERTSTSRLGKRLHASKKARLVKEADRTAVEKASVACARELAERHTVVAVVMNRVASAATVQRQLRESLSETDVLLLTGRMRPLDRDDIMKALKPRIQAGRKRSDSTRPLVVVGTQCIEAGADFDFDAMVTEAASLDALKQRFGRLDRLGEYGRAEAVIVAEKGVKDDPVYGAALAETIRWLDENATGKPKQIDFGVLALPTPTDAAWPTLLAPKEHAPVLLPAYMDLWIQTSPEPAMGPDATLFLHGPRSGPAEVQIVWRADLSEDDLDASHRSGDATHPMQIVSSVRPSSLEAIAVPFVAARNWLAGAAASDIADVEVAPSEGPRDLPSGRLALRWRGDDSTVIGASLLRPGDTIVVPASRGGIWAACFDPDATAPVPDLAERASLFARGRPVLRLQSEVLAQLGLSIPDNDLSETRIALATIAEKTESGWRRLWLAALARGSGTSVVDGPQPWPVIEGRRVPIESLRRLLSDDDSVEDGAELTTDEDDSYAAGAAVPLSTHSGDVERFARVYARAAGLPKALVEDVALAGWLHDIGKADRRFQILLRGGSEIEFYKDETLLAKSAMSPGAKAAQRLAQRRSGYPPGARHEVQSVAMIEHNLDAVRAKATDLDLVLHLVGSHHGHCRPFAPAVEDAAPVAVSLGAHNSEVFGNIVFAETSSDHRLHRLDSPLADRFWRLVERYGWLELCGLEAILRLADHRASEEEQLAGVAQ